MKGKCFRHLGINKQINLTGSKKDILLETGPHGAVPSWGDGISGVDRTLGRALCPPRRPPQATAQLLSPPAAVPGLPHNGPGAPPREPTVLTPHCAAQHARPGAGHSQSQADTGSAEPVRTQQSGVCRGRRHENPPLLGHQRRQHDKRSFPSSTATSKCECESRNPGAENSGDAPEAPG